MKQDLPWSVSGIPPEARDIARAAASRDGVSVGDWITRRILGETARTLSASERGEPVKHYRNERDEETRRDREDLTQRLAKTEAEADSAFRRIDETLRSVARRMETTERSQNEAQRAMSAAAAEIALATREQAQAFDHLNKRIDNVEHQSDNSALRDAVRGLHQGLSRLADQIAKTATEASGQVGMIAQNVETLAVKVAQVRDDAALSTQVMDGRMSALSERLRLSEERLESDPRGGEVERLGEIVQSLERTIDSIADRLAATEMLAINFARVETKVDGTEERMQEAMAKHLAAIDASIGAIRERLEHTDKKRSETDATVQESIETLGVRIDSNELHSREVFNEIKALGARIEASEGRGDEIPSAIKAMTARIETAEAHTHQIFAEIKSLGNRIEAGEDRNREVVNEIRAVAARSDATDGYGREVFEEIKALGARIDASDAQSRDIVSEIRALGNRIDSSDAQSRDIANEIKALAGHIENADDRGGPDLTGDIRALATRVESADARSRDVIAEIKALSTRIDANDARTRDAIADVRRQVGEAAKRVDTLEHEASMAFEPGYAQQPKQAYAPPAPPAYTPPQETAPEAAYAPLPPPVVEHEPEVAFEEPVAEEPPPPPPAEDVPEPVAEAALDMEPQPASDFDLPPFADAPPFPSGTYAPHPADDYVPPPSLASGEAYGAEAEADVPPVAQDYLAAARRAARPPPLRTARAARPLRSPSLSPPSPATARRSWSPSRS
jgi:localization factor PodJL